MHTVCGYGCWVRMCGCVGCECEGGRVWVYGCVGVGLGVGGCVGGGVCGYVGVWVWVGVWVVECVGMWVWGVWVCGRVRCGVSLARTFPNGRQLLGVLGSQLSEGGRVTVRLLRQLAVVPRPQACPLCLPRSLLCLGQHTPAHHRT
jgi:hypothetical protein